MALKYLHSGSKITTELWIITQINLRSIHTITQIIFVTKVINTGLQECVLLFLNYLVLSFHVKIGGCSIFCLALVAALMLLPMNYHKSSIY